MLDCLTELPLPGRVFAPSGATRNPLPAFVAGPENRLVAATIKDLIATSATEGREKAILTPLIVVLVGPSGTGKSHLLLGLVRHWQSQRGEHTALYTTTTDFRHCLNDAAKRQTESGFRDKFRGRQFLAIDDLQHLPADRHVCQELRYTMDDYEDRDATVIVTSTEPISVLPNLPLDLRSRLAGGLTLHVAAPGEAARRQILRHAARALDHPLSDSVVDRLAHGIDGTASNLFGALFELCETKRKTLNDAACAEQLLSARAARRPTLAAIVSTVARYQNVPQSQLKSSSRRQSVVFARGIVAYLARELAGASYDEIGRILGGRDHTTIIHNYRKIAAEREREPQTKQILERLQSMLHC
jgi:chromosomal replication initiator protein